MNSEQLLSLAINALEERKAVNVQVLDVRKLTTITDHMVVASGRSTRQVSAIAEHLIEQAKANNQRPMGTEGLRHGEWVLIDLCDVVVHLMTPETREFYQLEKLWGGSETIIARPG